MFRCCPYCFPLHETTHIGFMHIMPPSTFHIKNPSNAKLASLSIFRKWPVSMATIGNNRKIQKKYNISVHIQAIFIILLSGHISILLRLPRVSVCLCAKFDQFLPVRSHFDTKHPVHFFHIATFPSPTLDRFLRSIVLCFLRKTII